MPRAVRGHIEQLPSGSYRVSVYAGVDPLTRQEIRLRSTVKGELQAQIELGRLLKEASEGRTPEVNATMAGLMDQYMAIAEWDVSTRQTNEGFIRRTIKPALGHLEVRKVRGPILDRLYTRLKRCGDLSCTGRPFTEHRNVPALTINRDDSRPAWRQVSGTLEEAIRSGLLAPCEAPRARVGPQDAFRGASGKILGCPCGWRGGPVRSEAPHPARRQAEPL